MEARANVRGKRDGAAERRDEEEWRRLTLLFPVGVEEHEHVLQWGGVNGREGSMVGRGPW